MDSSKNLDILIIEDDPSIRELVSLSLLEAGHRVIKSSAIQAMDLAENTRFSLVVLDCNSPNPASAQSTIHRLRLRYPPAIIVAISGYFPPHATRDARLATALGADCTLGKPFRCEELVAMVQRLARSITQSRGAEHRTRP
ncbi:response regulator [Paraburkholderia fungorum]|uniref:response regulator n=1 Tax=Paraburkholderia fungorum TaxID=134537 RepID=UPI0020925E7F|nr:response regulator [Paraburkholderia fungorum]USU21251.1 response regulator [Paraburkholderia fungorum]USU26752.1 response regulator [Paraburkholderia fungorum]